MKRVRKMRWENPFIFICFVVAAAILGALMLEKYHARHEIPPEAAAPAPGEPGTVILYFSAPDSDRLQPEARRVGPCADVEECVADVVDELVNGPVGELAPTLPSAAVVRSVALEGDLVTIDWGSGLQDGLPEGSSAEMTAVYSVVDTIVKNFPAIRHVSFLIEGEPVETLKGHIDLRDPIAADFSLVTGGK